MPGEFLKMSQYPLDSRIYLIFSDSSRPMKIHHEDPRSLFKHLVDELTVLNKIQIIESMRSFSDSLLITKDFVHFSADVLIQKILVNPELTNDVLDITATLTWSSLKNKISTRIKTVLHKTIDEIIVEEKIIVSQFHLIQILTCLIKITIMAKFKMQSICKVIKKILEIAKAHPEILPVLLQLTKTIIKEVARKTFAECISVTLREVSVFLTIQLNSSYTDEISDEIEKVLIEIKKYLNPKVEKKIEQKSESKPKTAKTTKTKSPEVSSDVQEKELIVTTLLQMSSASDASFIESLDLINDLKTLEECSQVLVQKVIEDCSLTEKCVRILSKILNLNDINAREATMEPIQLEFELQKSSEIATSVINYIGELNKKGIFSTQLNFCCLTTLFEAANTGNENCLRLLTIFLSKTSGYFTERKILPLEIFTFLLKQRDSRIVKQDKIKPTADDGKKIKKKKRKKTDALLNDLKQIISTMENSWNDLKNVKIDESTEQIENFEQILNELNSKNLQETMKKLEELEPSSDESSMREYAGLIVTKANMSPEIAQNLAAICFSLHEVLSPATKAKRFRNHLEEAVDFVFNLFLNKTTQIHQGNNAAYFICHLRSVSVFNNLKIIGYIEKIFKNEDALLTVTILITFLKAVDNKIISGELLNKIHQRIKIDMTTYDFKGAVKAEVLQTIGIFECNKRNKLIDSTEWIGLLNGDDLSK